MRVKLLFNKSRYFLAYHLYSDKSTNNVTTARRDFGALLGTFWLLQILIRGHPIGRRVKLSIVPTLRADIP
jgi:hypothetical protein